LYVIFPAGVLLLSAFADRARNFWLAVPVDGGQRRWPAVPQVRSWRHGAASLIGGRVTRL